MEENERILQVFKPKDFLKELQWNELSSLYMISRKMHTIWNYKWDTQYCILYLCLQVLKFFKNPFDSIPSLLWPFQNYVSRLLTSKENILVSTSFRNRKNNDAKQYFTVQFSTKFCWGLVAKTTKSSMIKFNGVF